jgi:hypothetical protein
MTSNTDSQNAGGKVEQSADNSRGPVSMIGIGSNNQVNQTVQSADLDVVVTIEQIKDTVKGLQVGITDSKGIVIEADDLLRNLDLVHKQLDAKKPNPLTITSLLRWVHSTILEQMENIKALVAAGQHALVDKLEILSNLAAMAGKALEMVLGKFGPS